MKGKSTPKIQRRAAGLQIRAILEPRPNTGANLASDIFSAVKESEATKPTQKRNQNQTAELPSHKPVNSTVEELSKPAQITSDYLTAKAFDKPIFERENKDVSGSKLIKFGDGNMRIVSLQPAKPRKINKQPKKPLKIITGKNEMGKIPILFERTKAEELYDLLYQLTLGADEPCETVRVRRSDLMASTNIKTRLTLDLNLKRLEENDLLKIESRPGEQEGNIYTVFPVPEGDKR